MIPRRVALTIPPLVAMVSLMALPTAFAATYADVPPNHPFHKEITWATSQKYILPATADTFAPAGTID